MENVDPALLTIPKSSHKRKSYTIEDKILFIDLIAHGRTQAEICNEYNVCHSTLGTILSNKEKIISHYQNNDSSALRKRNRCSKHEDIEKMLLDWFKDVTAKGFTVNGTMMRSKANEFASFLNKEHVFKANNGWFQRFKTRNSIQLNAASQSVFGDQENLSNILKVSQRANITSKSLKNGSLSQLDEDDEENFTDELTSNSNSNGNQLNEFDNEMEFNDSDYFQADSYEVPSKHEALSYLYKLRSFFESAEKVNGSALSNLDALENELLNA